MPRIADALDRESRSVDLEHGDFERLLDRRERKQRNRRIRAGAVAVIVALATATLLARSIAWERVPANLPKPLGAGEVLTLGQDLLAQDPDSGDFRTIADTESLPRSAGESITSAAWSQDRQWVAFRWGAGSGAGSLWVADTNGGVPRRVTTAWGYSQWAWSPTDDELVAVRGRDVSLIDAATGSNTDLGTAVGALDSEGEVVHTLTWSPDGSRIAYDGEGGIYSIDVESGDQSLLVGQPAGLSRPNGIDWSPDGTHLAISYYSRTGARQSLYLANADGSDLRLVVESSEVGMAWSPNGARLAYTSLSGPDLGYDFQAWTVSADGSAPSLVASQCCVTGGVWPVWSPDGLHIALETEYEAGTPSVHLEHVVVNADGTGDMRQISALTYRSWQGGGYSCGCYG